MHLRFRTCFVALVLACVPSLILSADDAENKGQGDLDKATERQLTAKTLGDLAEVIDLCDSAIEKGLSEENEKFAEQLLSSVLYQRAEVYTRGIFDRQPPDTRWPLLRHKALRDLDRAVKVNRKFPDAQLMIARLEALPGGKRERAAKAAAKAADLFPEDPKKRSQALMLQAQLTEKLEERVKILAKAVEIDPGNVDAWQMRAMLYLSQGKVDEAVKDINKILKADEKNVTARLALAEALTNMEKYDEALPHVDKAIEVQPDSTLALTLRARIHVLKGDLAAALKDLDKAIKLKPDDVSALLMRAQVHQADGKLKRARADVNRALALRQGLVRAYLLRSMISAAEGKWDDAIDDMKLLVDNDPQNSEFRLQLGAYLSASDRPRAAIAQYDFVIKSGGDDWQARRARADAYLSVGKHAEAVADYEVAHKAKPDHSGILNNFAWVLATSSKDDVRNGKRAIELALKACEVTEYKAAHILSTLASGYAETGDWENAIKWSTKAVEAGEGEVVDQLKKELESYEKKKPWRELQETKERPLRKRRPRRGQFDA